MTNIDGKRIWVAGHKGMVGAAIIRRLEAFKDVEIITASSSDVDLRDTQATLDFVRDTPSIDAEHPEKNTDKRTNGGMLGRTDGRTGRQMDRDGSHKIKKLPTQKIKAL